MPTKPTPKKTDLVDAFNSALPKVVNIACKILGTPNNTLLAWKETENGGAVVITEAGQKFTFTAEHIANPKAARAELRAAGVTVLSAPKPAPAGTLDEELDVSERHE